jgi:hypothetical protein
VSLTLLFCLAPSLLATPFFHANSISVSTIDVTESEIRHELELQTLSVLEVLPDLDLDANGLLDRQELELGRDSLQAYLNAEYLFRINGANEHLPGGAITSIGESAPDTGNLAFALQRIRLTREFSLDALPTSVLAEVAVFSVSSPDHRDYCTLQFQNQLAEQWLFTNENPTWNYLPDAELESRLTRAFAINGFEFALQFNVLALVLLLVFACPKARSAMQVVGLYLLAGGLIAALSLIIEIPISSRIIALTMALAIPYVGIENALRGKPREPRIEAILFGCVLGIYLFQNLQPELVDLPLVNRAVFAHTAGFAVTLSFVAVILFWSIPKIWGQRHEQSEFGPNWLRNQGSMLISIVGLAYFAYIAWFDGFSA